MKSIGSVAELYAHAIAIEREAAATYGEFAERMADEGREELAAVFSMLAGAEAEHLETLERRTDGIELPALRTHEYKWLDAGIPEVPARELVMRLMTPRQALAIALHAEHRAYAFFEHASWTAADPGVRALAREMAGEEREHIETLACLLEATPAPALHSTLIFER